MSAVVDLEQALAEDAIPIHLELGDNQAFSLTIGNDGNQEHAANCIVGRRFSFGRQTGVPLEPRTILADYNPADESLTVHQSHQAPHLMQTLYAKHLAIAEQKVRVICPDVGGAFGTKLHCYGDEMAVVAISKLLGRPIKYAADRMEAFVADAHAREFVAAAKLSADAAGRLRNMTVSSAGALGAYSIYPRSSVGDGVQSVVFCGAPYRLDAMQGKLALAYQNKPPTGVYRGVGQPLACAMTEVLLDDTAAKLSIDPVAIRRLNYLTSEDFPCTTQGGIQLQELFLHTCLDKLCDLMDYKGLRDEQNRLREQSVYRGIGVATFIEQTAMGAGLYGPSGQPVTAQDSCRVRFEPSGDVRCEVSCTDQGQGTIAVIGQLVAEVLQIPFEQVSVIAGDSHGPYGGGAWASRGLAISGEAAYAAAQGLKQRVLSIAAALLQAQVDTLSLRDGKIIDSISNEERISLTEICQYAFFRQHLLPPDVNTDLSVQRAFIPQNPPYYVANGVQASYLEVDTDTGIVRLLKHWVVEDCGRVLNQQLVDEQIRGGVVQGLGAALFEQCIYDDAGQLCNGTLADYLVPMACEMPDIEIAHIETPQQGTELGVKGAGESGTVGALPAVWCAINDALRPLDIQITEQPFSPQVILRALHKQDHGF